MLSFLSPTKCKNQIWNRAKFNGETFSQRGTYRVTIGISHGVIWPKMDDHFNEPETYFMDETPGLSSVFLALQNVEIRIGIE